MTKPNTNCEDCPYWLVYSKLEAIDEIKRAIEEHCIECDACDGRCFSCDYFDPYKGECSREERGETRELLTRSLEMLYLLGYDSSFTNPAIDTLTTDIKKFLEEMK